MVEDGRRGRPKDSPSSKGYTCVRRRAPAARRPCARAPRLLEVGDWQPGRRRCRVPRRGHHRRLLSLWVGGGAKTRLETEAGKIVDLFLHGTSLAGPHRVLLLAFSIGRECSPEDCCRAAPRAAAGADRGRPSPSRACSVSRFRSVSAFAGEARGMLKRPAARSTAAVTRHSRRGNCRRTCSSETPA